MEYSLPSASRGVAAFFFGSDASGLDSGTTCFSDAGATDLIDEAKASGALKTAANTLET